MLHAAFSGCRGGAGGVLLHVMISDQEQHVLRECCRQDVQGAEDLSLSTLSDEGYCKCNPGSVQYSKQMFYSR